MISRNMQLALTVLRLLSLTPLSVKAFTLTTSVVGNGPHLYNLKCCQSRCYSLQKNREHKWSLKAAESGDLPEPLATEGDWNAYLDETKTGLVYYFNLETGESLWEPPTKTFPKIDVGNKKEKKSLFNSFSLGSTKKVEKESESDDPKPLATQVDWAAFLDEEDSGMVYYFNLKTGENLWDPPTKNFPKVTVGKEKPKAKKPSLKNPFSQTKVEPLQIESSLKILPHPAKASWGGEDAAFFQGRTFGVFDGVSGADKTDGIPLYSITLAEQMRKLVREQNEKGGSSTTRKYGLTTEQLIYNLNVAAKYANEYATGASTAIVASLGEDNFLRVLNVGDCALIVIRDSKVVSRSKDIIHYFDCPYQLSTDSPDRPGDGTKMAVEVLSGDRIVMASDGIFDNLETEEIINVLDKASPKASLMAKGLVNASRKVMVNPRIETPYSREEKKNDDDASGLGGKLDDISCVILQIS